MAIGKIYTIFPQNLAMVRLHLKATFGAVTIRRWLDLEGGIYRDRLACIIDMIYAHTYIACLY